jgi:hypothetical protein
MVDEVHFSHEQAKLKTPDFKPNAPACEDVQAICWLETLRDQGAQTGIV